MWVSASCSAKKGMAGDYAAEVKSYIAIVVPNSLYRLLDWNLAWQREALDSIWSLDDRRMKKLGVHE